MKYSIHGFSQSRAVELGLSNDDLFVLRWFVDFCGTGKMQSIKEPEGIYYWVNYQSVLDDLPVLRISKDRLYRKHFKALCNAQVLCHKHIKGGGSFSYYGYAVNYETLVYLRDKPPTVKLPEGAAEIPEGTAEMPNPSGETTAPPAAEMPNPSGEITVTKINLLNQSIIKPLIRKPESLSGSSNPSILETRFDEFWSAYPKKVGKKAAHSSWNKIKPDTKLHDKIMAAIGRARETDQWQRENGRFIPNPATWLNQGRWDDEYEEVNTNGEHRSFVGPNSKETIGTKSWRPGTAAPGFKLAGEPDERERTKSDPLAGFKRA